MFVTFTSVKKQPREETDWPALLEFSIFGKLSAHNSVDSRPATNVMQLHQIDTCQCKYFLCQDGPCGVCVSSRLLTWLLVASVSRSPHIYHIIIMLLSLLNSNDVHVSDVLVLVCLFDDRQMAAWRAVCCGCWTTLALRLGGGWWGSGWASPSQTHSEYRTLW